MTDPEISLVLRTTTPIVWAVEAIDIAGDGAIEMAQFSGPDAEQRARDYAAWKYGVSSPSVMAV
jgi:hypothetical protein